jgi:predicted AlkP superfamily phosphohydrolase/phosphomutase
MVEDHDALKAGHLDEAAYLDQCDEAWRERQAMMRYELDRLDEGFFFCLFDTPDRIQHMFWRFREPDHPANRGDWKPGFERAVEDAYRRADAAVGEALGHVDGETLLVVLSDHGFKTFRRGVHLNNWLHDRGLLALKAGVRPDAEAGDLFARVDWSRTGAYALGLAGIYVNQQGRERHGVVPPEDVPALKQTIARDLAGLQDPAGGTAVRRVAAREDEYEGAYTDGAPDLLVHFAEGYRSSWSTAMGGFGRELFEDNTARWAGDHIIDPELVPGVLLANRPLVREDPGLADLAPTVLEALGVPPGDDLEGKGLLA